MHNIQLSAENSGSPMANISHHNNYSLQKELLPCLKPEIGQIYINFIPLDYYTNSLWYDKLSWWFYTVLLSYLSSRHPYVYICLHQLFNLSSYL